MAHRLARILISLFCICFVAEVRAQWQALNGPFGTGIASLEVTGPVIYASGAFQNSAFFLSHDDGDHWTSKNSGLPETSEMGEIARMGSYLFVITGGGHLYRADTADYHWLKADTGLPPNPQCCHIMAHDTLLFLSTKYGLFLSADTGNTWQLQTNGIPGTFYTCLTEQGQRLFIATITGEIYSSEDNGDSWMAYNTTSLPDDPVQALFQAGSALVVGTNLAIYRTSDEGNTWTMTSPVSILYNVTCMMGDSAIIFTSTFGKGILRSDDTGLTWSVADSGLPYMIVYDMAWRNGKIMAATWGGIFISPDRGVSWTIHNDGLTKAPVLDIVCQGNSLFTATYLGISRSSDGGNSWDLVLAPPAAIQDLGHVSCLFSFDSRIYAGTYCNGFGCGGIYRSDDGGNSWSPVNQGLVYTDVTSFGSKGSTMFAGTGHGLFRSGNKGESWSLVFDEHTIYDIACTADTVFVACYPGVYCSADNGDTWVQVNNGLDFSWLYALHTTGSALYGGSAYLYRTGIDPVAWQKKIKGMVVPASVYSITSKDSLVFAGAGQGVYVSSNYGDEWFLSDSGFPPYVNVNDVLVHDTVVYAGTYYGLWKIPVSQMYVMEAAPDTVRLEFGELSTGSFIIHSNASWTLEGTFPGWLSADVFSGAGSDTITFTALATNPGESGRSATFRLVSPSAAPLIVTVLQKPFKGSLSCSKDSVLIDWPAGSSDTVYITSNTNWLVEGGFPGWFIAGPQVGYGNDTLFFRSLEENTTGNPRTFELVISAFMATPERITITQKGHSAGTDDEKTNPTRVYPDPCDGLFYVESQFPIELIEIFGSDGTLIESRTGSSGLQKERFLVHRKGVLFIVIHTSGKASIRKVMVY